MTRGARELAELQWGLIPHFSGDPPGEAHVNARAETVSRKPSFRDAFRARRGVVPVSGFYGWKGTAGRKQPYYFRPRGGGLTVTYRSTLSSNGIRSLVCQQCHQR